MLKLPLGTAKTRIRSGLKKLGVAVAVLALAALVWVERDQRAARARGDRALAMVTSSDAERLRLDAASGVSAASHGNYRRRAGVPLVVLTLSNLDPPPAARRYVAWALAGGRTIALGAATRDADGKALLIAEDPALAQPPEAVWVTVEVAGDAPAPRGSTVLSWHR